MEATHSPEFEIELNHLVESINLKYDYDFRDYSSVSMKRTVVQAMNRMGFHTLAALEESVLQDVECFLDLLQSLTISVSEMFRDPTYYLALREKVIPLLKTYSSVKIWVAGCCTGEEVYSLAILLQEEGLLERTTLYATDINQRSLDRAESRVFSLAEIQAATAGYQKSGGKHQLADYYTVAGEMAIFDSALKKNITFTDHSLVTDAEFSEMQLISCRNVLIYFNRRLQDRVIGLFHKSLCRRGFLGLGSQETILFSLYANRFDSFDKARIFQKK